MRSRSRRPATMRLNPACRKPISPPSSTTTSSSSDPASTRSSAAPRGGEPGEEDAGGDPRGIDGRMVRRRLDAEHEGGDEPARADPSRGLPGKAKDEDPLVCSPRPCLGEPQLDGPERPLADPET